MLLNLGKHWRLRCTTLLLAATLLASFDHVFLLRQIASFLIVENPLKPAGAIVVLNGGMPSREIEAARIYKAGWAPRVIVVKGGHSAYSQDLQNLGLAIDESWKVSLEVLIRHGVATSDIVILKSEPRSTLEELKIVASALGSKNEPVILVTSPFHTLRTRLTWEYLTESKSRPIVRVASREGFQVDHWWKRRDLAWSVLHEYLGLANYYAGFPVAP